MTPEIVTGLRVGFSLTLLGVIIGEMFASQQGLGFLIINGMNVHDVRTLTAVVLLLVLFAVASSSVLLALERRLNPLGAPRTRVRGCRDPRDVRAARRFPPVGVIGLAGHSAATAKEPFSMSASARDRSAVNVRIASSLMWP